MCIGNFVQIIIGKIDKNRKIETKESKSENFRKSHKMVIKYQI